MSNSTKGASKLAAVLQSRMSAVYTGKSGIVAERGEILKGGKLKLYSLPEFVLDKSDYSVCATVYATRALKNGDRVLVIWTNDNEPVVIDRMIEAEDI